MPLWANLPPSPLGPRLAVTTMEFPWSSTTTSSPACSDTRSRIALGITICPFAPTRVVILDKYNSLSSYDSAKWRRGWDLNPRMAETINTLAGCPIRPLWHLSARNTNGRVHQPPSRNFGAYAGMISKWASVGAWLLIARMSCGHDDMTTTQSSRARSTT